MQYLVAVNLHDRRPPPISTSKISKVTENGSWFWVKEESNQLTNPGPVEQKDVHWKEIVRNKLIAEIPQSGWYYAGV